MKHAFSFLVFAAPWAVQLVAGAGEPGFGVQTPDKPVAVSWYDIIIQALISDPQPCPLDSAWVQKHGLKNADLQEMRNMLKSNNTEGIALSIRTNAEPIWQRAVHDVVIYRLDERLAGGSLTKEPIYYSLEPNWRPIPTKADIPVHEKEMKKNQAVIDDPLTHPCIKEAYTKRNRMVDEHIMDIKRGKYNT